MKRQPFSFEEFKEIFSKVPRLCVDLVIKNSEGVLLTLRDITPHKNQWHLPGGTVQFKEPVKQAAARVAADELGIEVTVGDFLGYIEYFNEAEAGGFDYPVSLVFLCSPNDGQIIIDEQASEAKFFKEMPNNIVDAQAEFIRDMDL